MFFFFFSPSRGRARLKRKSRGTLRPWRRQSVAREGGCCLLRFAAVSLANISSRPWGDNIKSCSLQVQNVFLFFGEACERQVKRNAVIVSADKSQTAAFCLLSEEFQWIDALDWREKSAWMQFSIKKNCSCDFNRRSCQCGFCVRMTESLSVQLDHSWLGGKLREGWVNNLPRIDCLGKADKKQSNSSTGLIWLKCVNSLSEWTKCIYFCRH